MLKNKFSIVILFILLVINNIHSQTSFSVVSNKEKVGVFFDKKEAKVVGISAEILANDIGKITGKYIEINGDAHKYSIIAGTIGQSDLIDRLVDKEKITIDDVEGKWETYKIQVVKNPFDRVNQALVIIGSDRRATAYGLLEVSRMIGVSPWEWWADVFPETRDEISINVEDKVYGTPSVKYRGIFIDDENKGLQKWAALNYEIETGDIGPKTYAKIFELLLRLRANTIWPALNKNTKGFYQYPRNKDVADDYAIVVGSSGEAMQNKANREKEYRIEDDYRFGSSTKSFKSFFKSSPKESEEYDKIYTLGIGENSHSFNSVDITNKDSEISFLEQVITDQRDIIEKNSKYGEDSPQVFIQHKKSLEFFQSGLYLPDNVTLMWPDDNYGYIPQLSSPVDQKRNGGAGVYYHTSYWGKPHDYLWLNSTNPVLMWEEMSKAYEFNAKDIWILNCGDIKPHEYNIELFLDMAWNINSFKNSQSVKKHRVQWATREFGKEQAENISNVFTTYDELAFKRRPEFMAWSQVEPVTKSKETELTQYHYGDEVDMRINKYQELINKVDSIQTKIPRYRKDAFYQLVYYPVVAAASINKKWLYTFKNKFVASQNRSSAFYYGEKSLQAYNRIVSETSYYNSFRNGKWNHIMSMSPRNLPVFDRSSFSVAFPNNETSLGLALEGYEIEWNNKITNSFANELPVFNAYTQNKYYIDVFLKGEGSLKWSVKPKHDWVKISKTSGVLNSNFPEERLWVSIDWDKVPKGEENKETYGNKYQLIPPSFKVESLITFTAIEKDYKVGVSVFNPKIKELEKYNDFVEDKGYVSINAANYSRKKDGAEAKWETFDGLGYAGKVAVALPRTAKPQKWIQDIVSNSPVMEYDFYTFNSGETTVKMQAIPTHAFYAGTGVRCAVAIDGAEPVIVDFETETSTEQWKQNVLKNAIVKSAEQVVDKPGKHTLKIWMVDPGVMIDQILIDLGGLKKSYSFPKETKVRSNQ